VFTTSLPFAFFVSVFLSHFRSVSLSVCLTFGLNTQKEALITAAMNHPFQFIPAKPSGKGEGVEQNQTWYHPNNVRSTRFYFVFLAKNYLQQALYSDLVILEEMPKKCRFLLAVLYYVCIVCVFFVLLNSGLTAGTSKTYLASSNGQQSSRNCELVPTTTSGTFYSTVDGYWEGMVWLRGSHVVCLYGGLVLCPQVKRDLLNRMLHMF
jgi:hypothetical protein